jgi:bifunctional DNA-binding transcriptional regulator/antitoxin component of YhaV-PrlF toxin-antitoxin module
MIGFMIMRRIKVSQGGQISVPAEVRRRWRTSNLNLDDLGDRIVLSPAPEDPIAAARGALAAEVTTSSEQLREIARRDEAAAETRRHRSR